MKKIITELITFPLAPKIDLDTIFRYAEILLKKASRQPLRLVLIEANSKEAKILASFLYEK